MVMVIAEPFKKQDEVRIVELKLPKNSKGRGEYS